MAAFSTKGVSYWIEQKTAVAPTAIPLEGVSNAKPAIATVDTLDVPDFKAGDVVRIAGTGSGALDGRTFTVGVITGDTFPLVGSDTSANVGAIAAGTITNYAGSLVEFCLSAFEATKPPAQAITVGTTCDPSAQIAGDSQAGSLSIGAPIDYLVPGYIEFMHAVDDGLPRLFEVRLPTTAVASGNGRIVYPSVTAAGYGESLNVNAAATWTGELVVGEKPIYYVT